MPSLNDVPGVRPMTTNNLTERMNKSIEGQRIGTQPINRFIERLYGITLVRDNIIKETSSQLIFEAGQVTYWNSRIIEHQTLPFKQPMDIKRRLNQGRLYVLLHLVKPAVKELDTYFYVKKGNNKFRSPYTMRDIYIDNKLYQLLKPMLDKLASKHLIEQQDNYYLVNISTGECTCLDFVWNGSFRDVCKHVHAARLFNDVENKKITLDIIKHDLVLYFRNKERAMPNEQKNFIIYNNSIDAAFGEILQFYSARGSDIFFPSERGVTEQDPFRPAEMPIRRVSSVGAPKVHGAKPRKSNGFVPTENKENDFIDNDSMLLEDEIELSDTSELKGASEDNTRETLRLIAPSIQKRTTAAIRNRKRSVSKMQFTQDEDSVNTTPSSKAIVRSTLENLFTEKRLNWKRCEFVKACIEQNIHLDNNAELNKKKLFTWFDGKKTKEKQISQL
ncbi:7581_t:CDS:2 [Cetraspora pellucida]|uniref:7581_t:CDS:1 n=1 Tax=Cetraspora pellucida TaxID=1433469 RepID=A0ACA9KJZ6_9GLOM|nr:7581_t:CDS:2 [Cetraspora pellucida]